MTRLSSLFSGFPGLSEELSSSCNLPTISWVTGFSGRSSMGLGDWVGLENQIEVSLQVTVERVSRLVEAQL